MCGNSGQSSACVGCTLGKALNCVNTYFLYPQNDPSHSSHVKVIFLHNLHSLLSLSVVLRGSRTTDLAVCLSPQFQVPGEMLRQIRYLNEIEMKKLSTRSVQKALKQMQNQLSKGASQTCLLDPVSLKHFVCCSTSRNAEAQTYYVGKGSSYLEPEEVRQGQQGQQFASY